MTTSPARTAALAGLLLSTALLAGCAGGDDTAVPGAGGTSTPTPPGAVPVSPRGAPAGQLSVDYRPSTDAPVQVLTLSCAPPGGTVPDPGSACRSLAALPAPFAASSPPIACTELYGGPQTARITGTWQGRPVDTTVDRTDGCGIARWDSLTGLLPTAS